MIKNISLFLVFLAAISTYSQQSSFKNYQYIVVPDKFDFVKTTDAYQTSSLTKFLLRKKGFKVFLSNEKLPELLQLNRCKALFATVKDNSNMFTVKSTIEIKDCYGKTLYTSSEGKSKQKDYKKGYHEAIRNAFDSMEDFEFISAANTVVNKKEVSKVVIAKDDSNTVITPKKQKPAKAITTKVKKEVKAQKIVKTNAVSILYAQPKNNGFQLVNLKPEVVFIILKTNKEDVFIIKGKDGTLTKQGNIWIAEYYKNDALVKEEYQVKF